MALLIFIPLYLIHHGRKRWGMCVFGAYPVIVYIRERDLESVMVALFTILLVLSMYWTTRAN